ncbi:hypothetical protein PRIPAC_76233 [Pristionchus pacificus]|nr:hypothetical protein PRIPAC_76233 [Pristionchus pacificus]
MEIPPKKKRTDSPEPTKVTTLIDFPAEILRKIIEPLDLEDRCQTRLCNRALEKAVATSKWRIGNVKEEKREVLIKNEDEGAVVIYLNGKRLHAAWNSKFRLCEMMQTSSLVICGDTYNNDNLRFVGELLDSCSFRTLNVHLVRGQKLTSRALNLIANTKDGVRISVSHQSLTDEEYLSIPRPVAYDGSVNKTAFDSILAHGNDGVFLELLRRGHAFPTMFTSVISSETLMELIKIVSASHLSNKMVIETALAIGEDFIEFANPEKIANDPEAKEEQCDGTTEPTEVTTFGGFQIPIEILRKFIEPLDLGDRCQVRLCNRAMENVVATSKWWVGRRTVKTESGVVEKKGVHGVQVMIKQRNGGAEVRLYLNEKRIKADWSGRFRLCEMLMTNSLEICGDTYGNEALHFVSDLLDNCTVNTLHLSLAPRQQLTPRTHSLITKANKAHLYVNRTHSLTDEEYLSIAKPVEFLGSTKAFDSILAPGNDGIFLELLRRGHDFPHIFSSIISPQTLANAIKIVSESHFTNKILIETPIAVGEAFVNFANPEKAAADNVTIDEYAERRAIRTYRYQSAEIVLTKFTMMDLHYVEMNSSTARFKINMN